MIINTKEIGKTMQVNLFSKSRLYSFDLGMNLIIVNKLSATFEHEFAIDNKALDLIKKFENPDLELKDNELIIKSGKNKFKVKTINASIPELKKEELTKIKVKLDDLKTARKFTSASEIRPVLTSVHVKSNGNIYATNSFIAYMHKEEENTDETTGINIPSTFIDILDIKDEEIEIQYNSYSVYVQNDNKLYISRIIMGDYPKLEKVFNSLNYYNIEFDYKELKDAINFASYVEKSKETNSHIICCFDNSNLKCVGQAEYETELNSSYENDYKFKITIEQMSLMLNTYNGDESLALKFKSPDHQLIIEQDKDTMAFTPLRVGA